MDEIKQKGLDKNLVFSISKSSNAHIIAFYWSNDAIEAKWLLRHDGVSIDAVKELSVLQNLAMGLNLQEDTQGRLEVLSNLPFNQKLYFANLGHAYGLIFDGPNGLSQLHEAYLDVDSGMCLCKCTDLTTKADFVETIQVDAASFLL